MAQLSRTPVLSSLHLVNPHLAPVGTRWTYLLVPADAPAPIPVAPDPVPLEIDIVGAGRTMSLDEFHLETASTSLLVLVDGTVVHEWYADEIGPGDLFLGASATKSMLAQVVGEAIDAGALTLDDLVETHVPELAGTGYAGVRVRHLLTMTSGVDWVENHRDASGRATALVSAFAAGLSSRTVLHQMNPRDEPGTRYVYCTADSQVLDWVRERATGVSFTDALTGLWQELGCTGDAMVAVDGDGVAMAGGGVAATAIDWARIGLLQVAGTRTDGTRLLDREWVDASSRPSLPIVAPGRLPSTLSTHVGFGYHWWPLDDGGAQVCADGSRGQFVYVDRDRNIVVVKTSAWAYADPVHDRQCRDLTYLALPAIAAAAADEFTDGGREQ